MRAASPVRAVFLHPRLWPADSPQPVPRPPTVVGDRIHGRFGVAEDLKVNRVWKSPGLDPTKPANERRALFGHRRNPLESLTNRRPKPLLPHRTYRAVAAG